MENKCAKVRLWDLLRGPAEALVLVRAVEQKYGPVESIYFQEVCRAGFYFSVALMIEFIGLRQPASVSNLC